MTTTPMFYRIIVPFDVKRGTSLVVNLHTAEVLRPAPEDIPKDVPAFTPEKYDHDNVSHPSHYNSGAIEVIEALEDWRLDFHAANAVKYVARAGRKDPTKEIEDLKKAVWYLNRKIENLTAAKEGRAPLRPNQMVRA